MMAIDVLLECLILHHEHSQSFLGRPIEPGSIVPRNAKCCGREKPEKNSANGKC